MIKIYTTPTQSIICDEKLKIFYYASKEDAAKLARSVKSSVSHRQTLSYVTEMLLSTGYKEVKP